MIALTAALGDLFPPLSFVKNSVVSTAVIAFCNSVLQQFGVCRACVPL